MSPRIISFLAISAIAFGSFFTVAVRAIAQTTLPKIDPNEVLKMVMVDQAQLSSMQRSAFQQYLQTANLPSTKVGKRCQYYGKPDIWCLVLDAPIAHTIFQQFSRQPFGSATSIKPIRRFRIRNS